MRSSALIAFLGVGLMAISSRGAEPTLVNGLAVVVNDSIITYEDIVGASLEKERMLYELYRLKPQEFLAERDRLRGEALELLVERQLILHAFKTADYKIPESIFEEHIDRVIKGRIRDRYDSRARMIKSLQAQGMKLEALRERIKEELIIDVMTAKNVSSEIIISPYKIESYYTENQAEFKVEDQVKLRTIFLRNKTERDAEATRKLAGDILARLESGASFVEEASRHSDGSQSAQEGDLKWTDRSVLRPELADVAFSLKPGQHSGVVETPEACFLMKVEDIRSAHVRPLADVRDEIEKTLKLQEQQRLRKQWIERLKSKSFIRYYPMQ